jgi:hypothetical protein
MVVGHFAVASDQARDLESELANGRDRLANGAVVLTRVSSVWDQLANGSHRREQRPHEAVLGRLWG